MKPELEASTSRNPPGRLILEYLAEKRGATMPEIVRHLKSTAEDEADIGNKVENMLESAIAMGFLERKGSLFQRWEPREAGCCRRRKPRCRRRRRCCRRRPRRCCCSKRRRRRCCS